MNLGEAKELAWPVFDLEELVLQSLSPFAVEVK